MFERLKAIFDRSETDSELLDDGIDPVALASAMTLMEVAWADHELEPKELALIRDALASLHGVTEEQSQAIVDEAERHHQESIGLHSFTNQLNENLDLPEKQALLVELWRMNDFDGSEFHYEESVIRKISELLYMRHSEFIAAKLKAKALKAESH